MYTDWKCMREGHFNRVPPVRSRAESATEYQGRPIIDSDTRINGGVYLGSSAREAIVVDFEKDDALQSLYEEAKRRSLDESGHMDEHQALLQVYVAVKEAMETSGAAVYQLVTDNDLGNNGKVYLGSFIDNHIGVCRHQNLACAAILERFIDEGLLHGSVSIDRSRNEKGGHAWCRYTTSTGRVTIVDVTHEFVGDVTDGALWDYRRPSDQVDLELGSI